MLYKLKSKSNNEECSFSKKQIEFLNRYIFNKSDFEVVNMSEIDKPNKEEVEKQIKELEDKKASLDEECRKATAEKKVAIDKEIEEKKKSLEELKEEIQEGEEAQEEPAEE